MVVLLWVHVPAIVTFSVLSGHGLGHGLIEAGIVASAATAARWGPDSRRFRSIMATLGLVGASAILVHLSGGYIEFHFHLFFALAAISFYQDWAPFLTAVGFVMFQHGVVGVLDPNAVFNHPDAVAHPLRWAAVHGAFVVATSVVSLVGWKSTEVEALKDPLTWLPNRAFFGERLRQALARREDAMGVAVLFIDIDDFKTVNDTAGHAAGDRLLAAVARRLRAAVRQTDTVARLGGDEFAIVLEDVDEEMVIRITGRIQESLREPIAFEGLSLSLSVSIGVALTRDELTDEADLLRNADIAMYAAKKNGKGSFELFEPGMHRTVLERAELTRDLTELVGRDELRVLYQPLVSLEDGCVVGVEALLRWDHPTFGTMGPMRFIPLSEETGHVVGIGRWALETACVQAVEWDRGLGSRAPNWISVNVSVRQLREPGFATDVGLVLLKTGVNPSRIILEITESTMIGENDEIIEQLRLLKATGVQIAMDDFGTGYSTLNSLRQLPVDILKIDKMFVDGVDQGSEEAALARAILKIADSMGMRCVAEGVEREEQARQLRAAGCRLAQGFLFSRPVEPDRITALLDAPKRTSAIPA